MSDLWRVFSSSPFFFYLNSSLLNMICLWGTFFLVIGIFILVPLTRPLWRKTNGHAATPDLSLHTATCHSHYIYASKPGSGYRYIVPAYLPKPSSRVWVIRDQDGVQYAGRQGTGAFHPHLPSKNTLLRVLYHPSLWDEQTFLFESSKLFFLWGKQTFIDF